MRMASLPYSVCLCPQYHDIVAGSNVFRVIQRLKSLPENIEFSKIFKMAFRFMLKCSCWVFSSPRMSIVLETFSCSKQKNRRHIILAANRALVGFYRSSIAPLPPQGILPLLINLSGLR